MTTIISSDLSSDTVWPAGTYYLIDIVRLGAFNLVLDASAGPIIIKTDGSKYIWADGSGCLRTLNTSLTNKVIFTSKNDDSKGESISGSTGSPAKGDQTVQYFRTTDNNITDCSYIECWYAESETGVLRIGTTINKPSMDVFYDHVVLKYCGLPAGLPGAAALVGISGTFNSIGDISIQNLSIDSTNSLKDSANAYAVSLVSAQSITFNSNFINTADKGKIGVYFVDVKTSSTANIRNNCIVGDFDIACFQIVLMSAVTLTNEIYQNIFSSTGSDACVLFRFGGTFVANVFNNLFMGASTAGKYGCNVVGTATINEADNGWYNNDNRASGFIPTSPIDADPQLGNLPGGSVITAGYYLPDGYAVGNLSDYEKQGSDTFNNLGIDETLYTATGYEYSGTDKVTPGVNYKLSTFASVPVPANVPSSFSIGNFNITSTGQLIFDPNSRTSLWLQNPYF